MASTHRAKLSLVTLAILFLTSCAAAIPTPPPAPTAMSSAIAFVEPKATATPATPWPTQEWRTSTPEQQGMDSDLLARMMEYVQRYGTHIHSILIVRNGYLVMEAYRNPFQPDTKHDLFSCTKSITSALVGIAIGQGYIDGVDHKVLDWFPEKRITIDAPRKRAITLEHLLTMSSGLQWFEGAFGSSFDNYTQMARTSDWVQFVLDRPMADDPGTRMVYNSGGSHLLSAIISKTTGQSALAFARTNLFGPLGITDILWPADPNGISSGGVGLVLRPRDMAKIGYLYLNKGMWEGKQVVPAQWVKASGAQHIVADAGVFAGYGYGYQWWIPPFGGYAAQGLGRQEIYVLPEQNMVVVFTSAQKSALSTPPQALTTSFILPAFKSAVLPENPTAAARLQVALAAIAQPQPAPVPPLPALAQTVSGKTFRFDANPLEISAVRLNFAKEQATLDITITGQAREWAIGLDNVYRITRIVGSFHDSLAARGSWKDESTLVLDLLFNGEPNTMEFEFDEKQEKLVIIHRDLTDYATSISGKLEK